MKRIVVIALAVTALAVVGSATATAAVTQSANGHGSLDSGRRQFSFSASENADGSVTGQATLVNRSFTGQNTNAPYQLHIEITCMNVIGNIAFFGGTTKRTNYPNLVDAVFFSVQDIAEPGKGVDMISRAFFWDDDPNTTGDPQACENNVVGDFPMEPIESGNIQVRS